MKNPIIQDDRTTAEKAATICFIVATDNFLSGWGQAAKRSIVAVPIINDDDRQKVWLRMTVRKEMKRIRIITGNVYRPKLYPGDHLHIYNTTNSFRYVL